MTPIAFMLANYAARQMNYQVDQGWAQAEQMTSAYFAPLATFGARFEAYLADVRALGFAAVDLWQPMLDLGWLTDEHLDTAADLLREYELAVVSFAGWLGATADEFERNCDIAAALGAPLLTGSTTAARGFVIDMLHKYGLKWGCENEAERTPEEILSKIGDDDADVIGVCADVGWFATHGYDAADALRALAPRLLHVHLKDVRRAGSHETCRFGEGIVPLERCVRALQDVKYAGALSIEHETAPYDPGGDCRASLALLRTWLA